MRLVRGSWGAWLAALALTGCKGSSEEGPQAGQAAAGAGKAMPVQVRELHPEPVRDTSEYLGSLISRKSITVYPQVAGYVQDIPLKPGDTVKAGQVLLVVDPRQQRANVQASQAQRASALAQREFAQSTRRRSAQLLKEGLMSRQDYDQAVAQAQQSDASARAIESQIQAQRVQLGFYEVSAPFSGVVGNYPVKVGDYVTPQTPLTVLDQNRVLEVALQVPVDRARRVQVDRTPVEVLDEDGKPVVTAPVFFVATTPDPATQLVEVRAAFDNTAGLRAGQLVRARVVFATRDALQVPTYAVTQLSSQSFVYTAAQGDAGTVAQRAPVALGQVTGNNYEVTGGVDAGTKVVVSGLQLLRDGQPIQPMPEQRGGEGTSPGVGGAGQQGQPSPQQQGQTAQPQGQPARQGQPTQPQGQPAQGQPAPQGQGMPGGPAQPGGSGQPQGPQPGGAAPAQ